MAAIKMFRGDDIRKVAEESFLFPYILISPQFKQLLSHQHALGNAVFTDLFSKAVVVAANIEEIFRIFEL